MEKQQRARAAGTGESRRCKCILFKDLILDILQNLEKNSSIALTLMYLLHLKGGNREQTLPTKSNPNPDLTDAGDAENR